VQAQLARAAIRTPQHHGPHPRRPVEPDARELHRVHARAPVRHAAPKPLPGLVQGGIEVVVEVVVVELGVGHGTLSRRLVRGSHDAKPGQ
jgi:hypothetical protein